MTIVAYKLMLTELEAQLLDGLIRFNVTGSVRSFATNLRAVAKKLEDGGVRGWEAGEGQVFYPDPDKMPGLDEGEAHDGTQGSATQSNPG